MNTHEQTVIRLPAMDDYAETFLAEKSSRSEKPEGEAAYPTPRHLRNLMGIDDE